MDNNSPNHIFRFSQLRPPVALGPSDTLSLDASTGLARKIGGSPPEQRISIAKEHLRVADAEIESLLGSRWAQDVLRSSRNVAAAKGTVREFRDAVASGIEDIDLSAAAADLSDYLLASKLGSAVTIGTTSDAVALYSSLAILRNEPGVDAEAAMSAPLRRPITWPASLRRTLPVGAERRHPPASERRRPRVPSDWGKQVERSIEEVMALHRSEVAQAVALRVAGTGESRRSSSVHPVPLMLSRESSDRLSRASQRVLKTLAIDPTRVAAVSVIAGLEAAVGAGPDDDEEATEVSLPLESAPSSLAEAQVRAAGIADLLVVKQHLRAYQRTDIAHVENIIAGEKKGRVHRSLERTEQTFITERERIDEKETELQTADRFELNQETEKTIQRDQQFGFGLTLSGKYGPTIEFSSNAEATISTSTEESTRSALTYAKDVMERSLERVTERVREQQTRTIIRETEETNSHELNNPGPNHVVGIYQFLEKEYESQVFNYGIRQMFDFVVPEPASYIWHLEKTPGSELTLPPAPPKLGDHAKSASDVSMSNYLNLAAIMGARSVEPPPTLFKIGSTAIKHGESGDEGGQPRSVMEKEIAVPDGYVPWIATVRTMALTDDDLTIAITIGADTQVWSPRGGAVTDLDGLDLGTTDLTFFLVTAPTSTQDPQSKIPFHVIAYETNSYSVVATVTFLRTDNAFSAWQIKTYDALVTASREQQARYDQLVSDLRARADTEAARKATNFDAPPSEHLRVVKGELKKHCLSIITQQWYDEPNGMAATDPPTFDLGVAAARGSFVRFFEQAFEWDQLQYVCYPYFWAQKSTWGDRFRRGEVDPIFLEFLQAGAARVVLPVRPGFEPALLYFLETLDATGTGVIWNGAGSPPPISSPLYVSIVQEIQERTGASQGEFPVGEPWTTILPTPLVILRPGADLPKWQRQAPSGWDWNEVP